MIVFIALTLCLELFASNVIDDHRRIVNYDIMLARWMVHINWRGMIYVDSQERDPVRVIGCGICWLICDVIIHYQYLYLSTRRLILLL